MPQKLAYRFQPKQYDERDEQGRISPAVQMTVLYALNPCGQKAAHNVAKIILDLGYEAEVPLALVFNRVTHENCYQMKTGEIPADLAEDLSAVFLMPSLGQLQNPYKGHSSTITSYPPAPYRSPLVEKAKAFFAKLKF